MLDILDFGQASVSLEQVPSMAYPEEEVSGARSPLQYERVQRTTFWEICITATYQHGSSINHFLEKESRDYWTLAAGMDRSLQSNNNYKPEIVIQDQQSSHQHRCVIWRIIDGKKESI